MKAHDRPDPETRVGFASFRRVEDDDYDVLADGIVVGHILRAAASPEGDAGPLGIMRIACPRTATWRRARPRWRRLLGVGGGSTGVFLGDSGFLRRVLIKSVRTCTPKRRFAAGIRLQ
jgi:hypothetical protein